MAKVSHLHFVRFIVVGGSATFIQFVLLIIFIELFYINKIVSTSLAFSISAIFNYMLNFHFTFSSKQNHKKTFPKFLLIAINGLLVNALSFSIVLSLLDNYLISQCIATLLVLILNYSLHRFWVYKEDMI